MLKSIHSQRYKLVLKLLREERENAEMTQLVLAEKIGVTQSVVSKMESGERRLDIVELLGICDAMQISQEEFMLDVKKRINRLK